MTLALFQNDTLPVRRPSEDARQYAYRIIRKFILELLLLPGQKMNEADLASSLNMSRTPIHDSFFKLSRENLVDVIPKRGAFVSKIDQKRIDDAVWVHQKLGSAMIHSIYIRRVPKSELELLYCLASSPNQVFTREQLLDRIWGYEYLGDTRTVDVHIKRLREKLKDHPQWKLGTVWGIGYKFETK